MTSERAQVFGTFLSEICVSLLREPHYFLRVTCMRSGS